MTFEVALFAWDEAGAARLVGRTLDPRLAQLVREELARERRRELAQLEGPVRLVPEPPQSEE
jgi:hypothetical protein